MKSQDWRKEFINIKQKLQPKQYISDSLACNAVSRCKRIIPSNMPHMYTVHQKTHTHSKPTSGEK